MLRVMPTALVSTGWDALMLLELLLGLVLVLLVLLLMPTLP
jgi:hypothetical protein